MKLFIAKKSFIFVLIAIIAAAAIIGICAGVASAASVNDGEKVIVIDAGHGGIDAGVLGVKTSTKESDINLAISKYLRGYFTDAGFSVVMTRTTQGGLY
ncbi:MAG: N-acetylmuramoyl-L-alanine amidase, partial [Clostridia bacterium]|nr:N-acetylmuramoyl-L-alanine amidase [Clostridia bacterium]